MRILATLLAAAGETTSGRRSVPSAALLRGTWDLSPPEDWPHPQYEDPLLERIRAYATARTAEGVELRVPIELPERLVAPAAAEADSRITIRKVIRHVWWR